MEYWLDGTFYMYINTQYFSLKFLGESLVTLSLYKTPGLWHGAVTEVEGNSTNYLQIDYEGML